MIFRPTVIHKVQYVFLCILEPRRAQDFWYECVKSPIAFTFDKSKTKPFCCSALNAKKDVVIRERVLRLFFAFSIVLLSITVCGSKNPQTYFNMYFLVFLLWYHYGITMVSLWFRLWLKLWEIYHSSNHSFFAWNPWYI